MQRLAGRTILAVDDDPDILAGMALALEAEAANVVRASDGAQAWTALQAGGIDAVVLDMMLPQLSGLAILERLGAAATRPPVVMVTANQGRRHREFATALGASAYFNKPVPLVRLVDAVCEALRQDPARVPRSYYIYGLPEHIEDLDPDGEIPRLPIGERSAVLQGLAQLNTSPDAPGSCTLYGPGIEISLPEGDGVLDFAVLRVSDEAISWPVMLRIAGEMGWCLWDPEEGRNLFRLRRRHDDF